MPIVTRTSGDIRPVMNMDAPAYTFNGVNAATSGATVNLAGPKLDFGTVTFTGIATPTNADLLTALQIIQSKCTIAMYRFTDVGANTDTLGLAVYNTGAWNFTDAQDLDTALTAALGYAVTTSTSATFVS